MALFIYILKEQKFPINNLIIFHLNILKKEEQTKTKANRRKKIIKMRAETNELEDKKTIEENQ